MKLYKLVSKDWTTRNNMKWEIGKTNYARGRGIEMCSDGVLHGYIDPILAMMLNPIHANFRDPLLLEVEAPKIVSSDFLKVGVKSMTPVRTIDIPSITLDERVAFGIYCAMSVCDNPKWNFWANSWLNGSNRSYSAANVAKFVAPIAPAACAASAAAAYANYYVWADSHYDLSAAAYAAYAAIIKDDIGELFDITLISCAHVAMN